MYVCLIGHRDSIGIEKELYSIISGLMKKGITDFYSGGMGNFDKLCEKIVKQLHGKVIFVPYNIKQVKERDKYWYDTIICPFGEKPYSPSDIPKRNRWLVDHSDIALCYVYKNGGAKHTLDYALQKQKPIINLAHTKKDSR